jgi:acyl-CoA reductase-like NAD-dependent aldehyde dehydrogenase
MSEHEVRALPLAGERFTGTESTVVTSPYDGHEIGRVPVCSVADVDRAVAAAKAALAGGPLPRWKRAEVLDNAARVVAERRDELAEIIAEEAAKPIKTARVEAERAVGTFQFAAVEARTLAGEVVALDAIASGEGKLGFTLRVPIGVVGAISPFNFPLNLVAHKLAPAIAAGCPIVLKPASQTPFSGIRLAELLIDDCGLPAEWLHVVTGGGSTVGNAIVDHEDVALITFTGSPPVGWGIRARAPRKKVGLELGNNAPVIIEADSDWQAAVGKIRVAGFSHAGQSCISTQRIYVHDEIADEFVAALVKEVSALVVGDSVAYGGEVDADGVLVPTVLTGVSPDMKVCSEEVFGPVVAVATYGDLDEALRLANDTRYGLQAAIFTHNVADAMKAFRVLDFGGVLVNEVPTWRADQQPYGGVRDSGNTREGPAYSVREMTELRMVVLSP